MNLGLKQLFRNIRSSIGQFLSILLVVAVGAFFFAGMNEASRSVDLSVEAYYEETRLAGATGVFGVTGQCAVDEAERVTGGAAEGRYVVNTSVSFGGSRFDTILLTATNGINKPHMTAGRAAEKSGECVIDATFAEANGLKIGDSVDVFNPQVTSVILETDGPPDPENLVIDNYTVVYTRETDENARFIRSEITGFFISPEYLYKINSADISAAKDEFAVVIVPYADVRPTADTVHFLSDDGQYIYKAEHTENAVLYNQVLVASEEYAPDEVFAAYEKPFIDLETGDIAVYVSNMSYTLADGSSEKSFRGAYKQISSLVAIVPTLFFLVAAVITFISMSKTVDNERTQIAVMQAVGRRKGTIYFMYTAYALLAAIVGSLLGGLIGMYTLPYLYNYVFSLQFIMPPFSLHLSGLHVVLSALIACAVAASAAAVSIGKTLRLNPAAAMRPKKEKIAKSVLVERWQGLWNRFNFGTKMIIRNILRNKLRILLSSIGVVGSVMLLIMGIGMYDRVNYVVDAYGDSLNYDYLVISDNAVPIDSPTLSGVDLPLTAVPVYAVTVTFGGETGDRIQLTSLPAGSDMIRLPAASGILTFADDSLIVPYFMADSLGVEVGDVVTLTGVYGQYDCAVTGISKQYLLPSIYCGRQVYDNLKVPPYADNLYVRTDDPGALAALESSPDVKYVRTRAEMIDRALDTALILNIFVVLIVAGAGVLALTVIYNITAINVHERERELATLMVLGYKRRETSRLIVVENVVTTIIGCLIGLPLGFGLFRWTGGVASSMNVSLPLNLTAPVIFASFGLAFLFSVLATLLLLKKVYRIDMVGALKSAE